MGCGSDLPGAVRRTRWRSDREIAWVVTVTELNFEYLDDVLLAASRKGIDVGSYFKDAVVTRIGPLAELLIQNRTQSGGFDVLPANAVATALRRGLDRRGPGSGSG